VKKPDDLHFLQSLLFRIGKQLASASEELKHELWDLIKMYMISKKIVNWIKNHGITTAQTIFTQSGRANNVLVQEKVVADS
jgi:hypothetical protein